MTKETKWGDWFAGTGARPEGVADDEPVQYIRKSNGYCPYEVSADGIAWNENFKHRLRADHPYYDPPVEQPLAPIAEAIRSSFNQPAPIPWEDYLKMAAAAQSVIQNPPPPDPDAREREECARLLDALGKPATADHLRSGDGSSWNKSDAMIAELKTILKERGL